MDSGFVGESLTIRLSHFLSELAFADLSSAAVEAAKRGVLDWFGCVIAGARHPDSSDLMGLLAQISDDRATAVLATGKRLGMMDALLAHGFMAHVLDFDDTRGTSAIIAALLGWAAREARSGVEIIEAYAAGIEIFERLERAMPAHHQGGWHFTGTFGTIAAGVASARLLRLPARQFADTLGFAATQAAGMQQNRGTAAKPFHAGKAAANGLMAALLARTGLTAAEDILEGRLGFCRIYSSISEPNALVAGLGEDWAIARNGYKPYICGLMLHPLVDVMLALREDIGEASIDRIEIACHPMAVAIASRPHPLSRTEAKFSPHHVGAVALLDGKVGLDQFSEAQVNSPDVAAIRNRISLSADATLRSDQARAAAQLTGGGRLSVFVESAFGSPANPMTNAALERKFVANAVPIIGEARTRQLAASIWDLETLADVRSLIDAATLTPA